MAIVAPTPITALPTPPSTSDPTNFDARGDAFFDALEAPFVGQANGLASNVYNNAGEALLSATAAAASESAAAASASDADDAASDAETAATASAASATLWSAFRALYIGTFGSDAAATTAAGGTPGTGLLYFNSAAHEMRVWSGSAWVQASAGAGYLPLSGGTLTGLLTAAGITLTAPLNDAPQATLASSSTVNIGAASSGYLKVTGTTTITAFDSIASGAEREVEFAGSLTLTHNAASLILPGGQNIQTAAGDVATFRSEGAGNWRCTKYLKASASPGGSWTQISSASPSNGSGAVAFTNIPTNYQDLMIVFEGVKFINGNVLVLALGDGTPNYTGGLTLSAPTGWASGAVLIPNAQGSYGMVSGVVGLGSAAPTSPSVIASPTASGQAWDVAGGVKALQISPSGGTGVFAGGGVIRLMGR